MIPLAIRTAVSFVASKVTAMSFQVKMIALVSILAAPVGLYLMHVHDQSVLARQALATSEAVRKAEAEDHAKAVAALEANAREAAQRAATTAPIRNKINAAPRTNSCASSPAVRATLDGLRTPRNAPSGNRPAQRPHVAAPVR